MPRGWGRGRGRGWFGRGRWTEPWPGNGPFSYFHLGKGLDGFMVEEHTGHIGHQFGIIEPSFCF